MSCFDESSNNLDLGKFMEVDENDHERIRDRNQPRPRVKKYKSKANNPKPKKKATLTGEQVHEGPPIKRKRSHSKSGLQKDTAVGGVPSADTSISSDADKVKIESPSTMLQQEIHQSSICITELPARTLGKSGSFLVVGRLLDVLMQGESQGLKNIPKGIKENVYFLLDNTVNATRLCIGKRSVYADDCGKWAASGSIKKHYYLFNGCSHEYLEVKGNLYCKPVKRKMTPLIPQPREDSILVLRRYYSSLKRDKNYKRRVSWIERCPSDIIPKETNLCVIEYAGSFPEVNKLKTAFEDAHQPPKDTNTFLSLGVSPIDSKDLKQVKNIKQTHEYENTGDACYQNGSDDIQSLLVTIDSSK